MDADIFGIGDFERPRSTRRRQLRQARPVEARTARERRPSDPPLEAMELWSGRTLRPEQRCHALGLPRGDCEQERLVHSAYCFYHDKLQKGLAEPTTQSYPVWPLPLSGYVFTDESQEVAS